MYIIVSYDITDDSKRKKVAEILKDYGKRVQYSVFECDLNEKHVKQIIEELKPYIEKDTDSLRIYFLCERCQNKIFSIGREISLDNDQYIVI